MREMRFVLAGTGYEGRDAYIRRFAHNGSRLRLVREPANEHDPNAISVWLECRALWGIFRAWKMIGYVQAARAAKIAPKIDSREIVIEQAYICNLYAPDWREFPDVTALVKFH